MSLQTTRKAPLRMCVSSRPQRALSPAAAQATSAPSSGARRGWSSAAVIRIRFVSALTDGAQRPRACTVCRNEKSDSNVGRESGDSA